MSFNIPEDKGAKKRKQYWNACIILGIMMVWIFLTPFMAGELIFDPDST